MAHPMSEQWMLWRPIKSAPAHGKQILVGFQGQFEWFSYVAPAMGDLTGRHMQFAPPTHWTEIVPPHDAETTGQ
jgi:predicted MFS family arabinose efflux permease